jgi:hypothetical protein
MVRAVAAAFEVVNELARKLRFALSRGCAVRSLIAADITRGGALEDSRLPRAIIGRPYQGFQLEPRKLSGLLRR